MMNFAYYIVRSSDMTLIDMADDVATAINKAEELGQKTIILQGCVITEMGEDPIEETLDDNNTEIDAEVVVPEVLDPVDDEE